MPYFKCRCCGIRVERDDLTPVKQLEPAAGEELSELEYIRALIGALGLTPENTIGELIEALEKEEAAREVVTQSPEDYRAGQEKEPSASWLANPHGLFEQVAAVHKRQDEMAEQLARVLVLLGDNGKTFVVLDDLETRINNVWTIAGGIEVQLRTLRVQPDGSVKPEPAQAPADRLDVLDKIDVPFAPESD